MKDTILLVAAGPMQHTPALQRGFDLARAAEAPVHICLFVHEPLIERAGKLTNADILRLAQHQFLEEQRQWLDQLMSHWKADGLTVTGEVQWAPRPHDAILAAVMKRKPALVVKDVGRASALRRVTFTALDWKLARDCPVPLMLVHAQSTHLPRRIAAAVDTSADARDGGPLNERVLREALKVADWVDADVHLAHVFPYLPVAHVPPRTLETIYVEARADDRQTFITFADSHGVPEPSRHWLEGEPVHRLVEFVGQFGVDLLVVGSTYHTALDRILVGSTAETLLFQMPCDLLLVKRPELAAALARSYPSLAA